MKGQGPMSRSTSRITRCVLYKLVWNLYDDSFHQLRMRWLPTYLAECKVQLGVTTEEPAFLPKVAELTRYNVEGLSSFSH